VRTTLFGSDGRLRLGWRLLVYALTFLACLTTSGVLGHLLRSAFPRVLRGLLVSALYVTALVASFRLLRRHMDRRAWSWFGLPGRAGRAASLAGGFACGVLMLGAVFSAEWTRGWLEVNWATTTASVLAIVGGLVSYVAVGLCEELFFRGAVFQNLGERFPLWLATLLTGVMFGLLHLANPAQHVDAAFVVACTLGTLLLVLARLVTGSLLWAIGWHAAWDWMQDLLGLAEPDTLHDFSIARVVQHGPPLWVGRAPSLEGGLLEIGVVGLAAGVFLLWAHTRGLRIAWLLPLVSGELPDSATSEVRGAVDGGPA
jgi:uncharacterized protein